MAKVHFEAKLEFIFYFSFCATETKIVSLKKNSHQLAIRQLGSPQLVFSFQLCKQRTAKQWKILLFFHIFFYQLVVCDHKKKRFENVPGIIELKLF